MDKLQDLRPTWAEINIDNLINNIKEVKRLSKEDTLITAVVKADGYGHGADVIAKYLLENGADRLAVATLTEAVHLRQYYNGSILVMGYTPNNQSNTVIKNDITQTIYRYEDALELSNSAKILNKKAQIHIKIETGMGRLGLMVDREGIDTIIKISKLENIIIEGMFTHFALADSRDKTTTKKQYEKFTKLIDELNKREINIPIKHVANSASIIDLKEYNMDMVRAGIMLYGLRPSDEVNLDKVNLKPAMSLKTKLAHIKEVDKGYGISYGHIYKTNKKQLIGTLPIGYADGYTRLLSEKAYVSINNKKAPIIGRICMDQCMVDLTNIDAKVGDEVILFGDDGISPSIDDIAEMIGTINYEIVCMISKRVPRVYVKDGKIIDVINYI
ncbi:alanine racemase [Clostridiaceae bacterium M8S5]|nr:alanine racemase [Clostridiaceae bacterium M8S5]